MRLTLHHRYQRLRTKPRQNQRVCQQCVGQLEELRHDEHDIARAPGTANTWAMATATVATFSRSWRCKRRGSTRSCSCRIYFKVNLIRVQIVYGLIPTNQVNLRRKGNNTTIKFNSIHFICQSVVCNCKYVTLKYMNLTDSRETPTKVQ